ncbi:hypothetical protein KC959_02945 [Candidatus Saccharibacteria bacterium]|nr:hypothetical protein [Candidatus Saccharibacteria bacterium]
MSLDMHDLPKCFDQQFELMMNCQRPELNPDLENYRTASAMVLSMATILQGRLGHPIVGIQQRTGRIIGGGRDIDRPTVDIGSVWIDTRDERSDGYCRGVAFFEWGEIAEFYRGDPEAPLLVSGFWLPQHYYEREDWIARLHPDFLGEGLLPSRSQWRQNLRATIITVGNRIINQAQVSAKSVV